MKMKNAILAIVIVLMFVFATACTAAPAASSEAAKPSAASSEAVKSSEAPAASSEAAKPAGKKISIGWVEMTLSNPYFKELVDAGKRFADKEGWEFYSSDSQLDSAKELKAIEDYITKGVDMIVIDNVDPLGAVASVKKAVQAGVKIIACDSSVAEGTPVITTVQSSNKENGIMCGNWLAKKMNGQPIKAVMLSGTKGNPVGQTRRDGLFAGIIQGQVKAISGKDLTVDQAWAEMQKVEDALTSTGKASYPDAKFEIVGQNWGDWNAEGGLAAMEDLLTAHPDINVLLTENDDMAVGAIKAIEKRDLMSQITICAAADGQKEAYKLIKDGKYGVTGENSPTKVATKCMEIVKEILVGGKDPASYEPIIYTPAVAVDITNVDKFYDPNAAF